MQKRTPYFKHIVRSYALAVLLPVILLCVLLYRMGVVELINTEHSARKANLSNVAALLSKRVNECNNMALLMSMEDSLLAISPQMDTESSIEIVSLLRNYVNTNPFFDAIIIQRDDVPLLYTSKGTATINVLMQREYYFSSEEEQLFQELLYHRNAATRYFPSARVIMSFVPFPLLGQAKTGCAVYVIGKEQLTSVLKLALDDAQCSLALVSEEGDLVYIYNGADLMPDWNQLKDYSGDDPVWINGKNCTVFTRKVPNLEWTLVWVRNYTSFFQNIRMEILFAAVICVFLLSIMSIIHHARRQYKPIQQISNKLGVETASELERIDKAVNEYRRLNEQVAEQKRMLQQNLLIRALSGEMTSKTEILKMCRTLEIFSDQMQVQVLVVLFKEGLDQQQISQYTYEAQRVAGNKEIYVLALLHEQSLSVICNTDFIPNGLNALETRFATLGESDVIIGVSTPYSLDRIAMAMMEARYAAENAREKEKTGAVFFTAYQGVPQLDHGFHELEQQFVYYLRQGREEDADIVLNRMCDSLQNNHPVRQMRKYHQFQIVEAIVLVVAEESIARKMNENEYARLSSLLTIMMANSSCEEFEKHVHSIVHDVCCIVMRIEEQAREENIREVSKWVEEHLTDPMLSLDMMVSDMGHSNAYWSRFFRERMSVGFKDYVSELRLQRSKELLTTTDLTVKEIVNQTGYLDTSSFIRKFRQQYGCTPVQYRMNNRENETEGI